MSSSRLELFSRYLDDVAGEEGDSSRIQRMDPVAGSEEDLLAFHTREFVNRIKNASKSGQGLLDSVDTPAFRGMYEASLFPVGNSLNGLRLIAENKVDHFFNPVGGLHHAGPDAARGFCVFNDCVIAILLSLNDFGMRSVAYVDIDAHHGDGVYYVFESDRRVVIGDIHEDGRYLYPGTGAESESGTGSGRGTKMNIALPPGSGDREFSKAFDRVEDFVRRSKPDMIFFQCGADGLAGDPITDLRYTAEAHAYASRKLHLLAHEVCGGRILAMGGGGYNPANVSAAWSAIVRELSGQSSKQ
ncbi:MAG: acetoin utilization protein AcuC [Thaumarchaeota archaeon]|nr:acetoin utilization protein AcuC [Nitrososphaerota archaeon]